MVVRTVLRSLFGPLAFLGLLAVVLTTSCGRSDLFDLADDGGLSPDGGAYTPPGCGDGACKSGESCSNCPFDCGECPGCGDGVCAPGEFCNGCPQDCGKCDACGDGYCKDGETCLSCAPDCGKCASCGDHTCEAPTETCYSCPDDCGACKGCGDGLCKNGETCASCPHDCGVCAVCGNQKCEGPYETCTNCHKDCGDCPTTGCIQMLGCARGCIDGSVRPPNVRVSCVADCVAQGCASAQFFFDQAFNCFLKHWNECNGADFGCLEKKCDPEIAACLGATCN